MSSPRMGREGPTPVAGRREAAFAAAGTTGGQVSCGSAPRGRGLGFPCVSPIHPKHHHEVLAALVDLGGALCLAGKEQAISMSRHPRLLCWSADSGRGAGGAYQPGPRAQSLPIPMSCLSVLTAGTII